MRSRCTNQNSKNYPDYGGRGITICEEWKSATAFIEWALTNGYAKGLLLDREDNDAGYSPDNCRWVDPKTSSRNKRNTLNEHLVAAIRRRLLNGETTTALSRAMGIRIEVIRAIRRGDTWQDVPPLPVGAVV